MTAPFVVVTTIQRPTPSMRLLSAALSRCGAPLIVIGDQKGPDCFDLTGAELVTLAQQQRSTFRLAQIAPVGHYSRKNVGYLIAMARGAPCIYETDDDNSPLGSWHPRELTVTAQRLAPTKWRNVYKQFTDDLIWPRGFPLDRIKTETDTSPGVSTRQVAPIQQSLVNGSPDVDAVWRLILNHDITFNDGPSVALPAASWCPFNSQTTWWWPAAYPLMYLPSHCSFRMTDIWRSFVAQRCLWEMGHELVFHGPEVFQERNAHRLIHDFEDEIPGYLNNEAIIDRLSAVSLMRGHNAVVVNLVRCYEALVQAKFLPSQELDLVSAWVSDAESAIASATRDRTRVFDGTGSIGT